MTEKRKIGIKVIVWITTILFLIADIGGLIYLYETVFLVPSNDDIFGDALDFLIIPAVILPLLLNQVLVLMVERSFLKQYRKLSRILFVCAFLASLFLFLGHAMYFGRMLMWWSPSLHWVRVFTKPFVFLRDVPFYNWPITAFACVLYGAGALLSKPNST